MAETGRAGLSAGEAIDAGVAAVAEEAAAAGVAAFVVDALLLVALAG